MRFGLSGLHGGLEADGPSATLTLAGVAEALGFDCLWFSEEHFDRGGTNTSSAPRQNRQVLSPILLAAAVAARTERIRIGFSVLLIPLHDPVRLAEEIATLDVLSNGRVNFGVARPGNQNYAEAFGHSNEEGPALPATLDRVLGYWSGEVIPTTSAQNILAPQTVQEPHPPVFVGGYTTATITWAASRGYPLMQHGIQSPASLARCLETYRRAGGDVGRVPVGRFVHVAETDRMAREQAWPTVQRLAQRLRRIGIHRRPGNLITTEDQLEPEALYANTAIIGGPDTVRRRIAELAEQHGLGYLNLLSSFQGFLPEPHLRTSLSIFASEVAPTLAGIGPRTA